MMARSKVADVARQTNSREAATMTPEARLQLAFDLGRRDIERYMAAHDVDFLTAARVLKRSSRAGRRTSRCADRD
jgi:hypothetical protein